jgi:hypothetical protein
VALATSQRCGIHRCGTPKCKTQSGSFCGIVRCLQHASAVLANGGRVDRSRAFSTNRSSWSEQHVFNSMYLTACVVYLVVPVHPAVRRPVELRRQSIQTRLDQLLEPVH